MLVVGLLQGDETGEGPPHELALRLTDGFARQELIGDACHIVTK